MKKVLIIFATTLLLLVAVPFTSIGQNVVLIPIINSLLSKKIKEHRVVVKELKPSMDTLETRFIIDNSIDIFTTGPIDWLSKQFNFKYMILSDKIDLNSQKLPLNMDIKGSLQGYPEDIQVYGVGSAFGASLKYSFKLIESKVSSIKVIVKSAKLKEILALAKKPPYIDGKLNLKINLPSLNLKNPEGKAEMEVKDGRLNINLLSKIFKVNFPRKNSFILNGKFIVKDKMVRGNTLLKTPLLSLKMTDLISTIDFKKMKSSFNLTISDLSYLRNIIKQPLRGRVNTYGKIFYNRDGSILQLLAKSKSFGGESSIFYNDGKMKARLTNVDFKKILYTLNSPEIFKSGVISLKANIKNLQNFNGNYSLKLKGKLNKVLVKNLYEFDSPIESFLFITAGSIKNGIVYSKTALKTYLTNLLLTKSKYVISKKTLDSKYSLKVANLSKLYSLIKTKLRGVLYTSGHIKFNFNSKTLKAVGSSKSFGGTLGYSYKRDELSLRMKKVNGVKILNLLAQKEYLKSSLIDGSIDLQNLKNITGVFNISSTGKLNRDTIKNESDIDLGSDLTYKLLFKGSIISDRLSSKGVVSTPIVKLVLNPFNYDLKSRNTIGEYKLSIPNLLKLESIIKNRYYGGLGLYGQFWNDEVFHITGDGKQWQGDLNFRLNDNLLKVNVKNAQMVEIFKTLGYEPMLIGKANASLKYNLESQNGMAQITADKSKLVQNSLVKALDLIISKNLATEIFNSAILTSQISKELVNFNFDMKSNKHEIKIQNGEIDRNKERIDAIVTVYDEAKAYKARLKGNLKRPKILPILTKELQRRGIKEMERILRKNNIDTKKIKKKIDEVVPKDIREQLKSLF